METIDWKFPFVRNLKTTRELKPESITTSKGSGRNRYQQNEMDC